MHIGSGSRDCKVEVLQASSPGNSRIFRLSNPGKRQNRVERQLDKDMQTGIISWLMADFESSGPPISGPISYSLAWDLCCSTRAGSVTGGFSVFNFIF